MTLRKFSLLFLLLCSSIIWAKKKSTSLKGLIIDAKTETPLDGSHLYNLNSVRGGSTDVEGKFEILARPNDTIMISYLGIKPKLKVTNDLLKVNELTINLYEDTDKLKELK